MNSPFKITFDASRGLRMMAQWDISCNLSNYFCHCVQWKKVWNKVIRNRRGRRSLLLKWKEMYRLQKLNDDFLDNLNKGSPTCIFILFFSMHQVLEKCPIFYPIFKNFQTPQFIIQTSPFYTTSPMIPQADVALRRLIMYVSNPYLSLF